VKLAVGDAVVYAAYGVGFIAVRERRLVLGVEKDVVVIELARVEVDLVGRLPHARSSVRVMRGLGVGAGLAPSGHQKIQGRGQVPAPPPPLLPGACLPGHPLCVGFPHPLLDPFTGLVGCLVIGVHGFSSWASS
jgi:hypothetical protein